MSIKGLGRRWMWNIFQAVGILLLPILVFFSPFALEKLGICSRLDFEISGSQCSVFGLEFGGWVDSLLMGLATPSGLLVSMMWVIGIVGGVIVLAAVRLFALGTLRFLRRKDAQPKDSSEKRG